MTCDEAEALILSFPEFERSTSDGEPSVKVQGKFFPWLRPMLSRRWHHAGPNRLPQVHPDVGMD